MKGLNSKNKNWLSLVSVAVCASIFWIVLSPLSIYLNNAGDFTIDLKNLVNNLIVIAGIVLILLLVLLGALPKKLSRIFVRVITLVTLVSWFFSSFLYGDYGNLDGKELKIEFRPGYVT